MAYLEYMLKCAGVPSGDALSEVLDAFQVEPADTLEKTAYYSDGIRALGKKLHGVSGGDMYKLGKCAALYKYAAPVTGAFKQQYLNEIKNIYAPQHKLQQSLSDASNNVKTLQGQLTSYQDAANRWQGTVDSYLKNPSMVGNQSTVLGRQTLQFAQQQLADAKNIVDAHNDKINMALLERDKAQLAYNNRPRLTPEQEARVKALKSRMRDEAIKAEKAKANANGLSPTLPDPSEIAAAEKAGKKSKFWGAIWDAWKESRDRKHELAVLDAQNTVEAGKAQRAANEAVANNDFELGKQQIAADVDMARSRNLAVGLGLGGAGGLGAIALANRPSQPLMYSMPAPAPAPVYPQPAPQQQYQQQQ